jgi:AcrR family transcriptional regulator
MHEPMSSATIENAPPRSEQTRSAPESARDRLIHAASDLFCRYGINATGIEAVIEAAGTAKATLYKSFGSKEGLIEAVLEAEGKAWRDWFIGEIDACPGTARDKLTGLFRALESWFAQDRFFGCPFINAVGEFDKKDVRYREIALAHKKVVMQKIGELAAETGDNDPEDLAHQIGLLIDGAIVAALITGDPKIARSARNAAVKILQSLEINDLSQNYPRL